MEEKTKKLSTASDKQCLIFINELESNLSFFEQHIVWNSKELWEPVVDKMNNEEGPTRSLDEWRKYLKRWKFGIRRKFRSIDSSIPGAMNIFTPVQQKLLLALGQLDVNICRGCFQNNKIDTTFILYPLFEEINDETILSERGKTYSKFIDSEIVQSDLLPHWLCNKCWDRCEEWNDFQNQCKQCDHDIDPTSNYTLETFDNIEEKTTPTVRKRANVTAKEKKKKVKIIDNKDVLNFGNIAVKQEIQDISKNAGETKPYEILTRNKVGIAADPLEEIFIKEEMTMANDDNEFNCFEEQQLEVSLKADTENLEETKLRKNDSYAAVERNGQIKNQTSISNVTEIKEEIEDIEEVDDNVSGFDGQFNDSDSNYSDENFTHFLDPKNSKSEPDTMIKPLKMKIENKKPSSINVTTENKLKTKPMTKIENQNMDRTDEIQKRTKRKFECDICGKILSKKSNMLGHLLRHSKPESCRRSLVKKDYQCFQCNRKCRTPSVLKAHMLVHDTQMGNHTCQMCGKTFKTPYRLRRHLLRHDPNSKMACLDCGKIYATAADLASHKKIHLIMGKRHLPYVPYNPYKCHLCSKSFVKIAQLIIHGQIHTDAVQLKCDFCEKTFIYAQVLERHKKIHLYPSDNPELDEEKYMNEEDPPVCELCNKTYKTRRNLRDHIYTCHRNLEKKYLCAECGKSFLKPHLLKTHVLQAHSEVAEHSCSECGKLFKTERRLRVHQRIHDPEAAKFACSECDKRFITASVLQGHFRKHTGERPYVCETCNKSFKASNHLKTHNRIHTGVRPFSCDICYMTFTYSDVLKRHRLKHANNVEYP